MTEIGKERGITGRAMTTPAISAAWSVLSWLLLFALLALAALQFATTLLTLYTSTLQHPFQDQFRLNARYLTEPFPLSVLLLENGHRPVFPGIVRVAELAWLDGSPWMQAASAWSAALLVTFMLLWDSVRTLPRLQMATATCLVFSLLWWNANARMFIHAYEATHVFYVAAGLMVAIWCAYAAARDRWRTLARVGALLACLFATFSFGPGFATFAALFVVAILRRERPAVLAAIAGTALAAFVTYAWVMPGAAGVRNVERTFMPLTTLYFFVARLGAPLYEVLQRLNMGESTRVALAAACGTSLLAGAAAALFADWRARRIPARLAGAAIGLLVFGVTTNFLIVMNRTDAFVARPDQLFADRYLFWTCLTWLGAGLYALGKPRLTSAWRSPVLAGLVLAASIATVTISLLYFSWADAVYGAVEVGTAAYVVGRPEAQNAKDIADPDLDATHRGVDIMRAARKAGYENRTGQRVPVAAAGDGGLSAITYTRAAGDGRLAVVLPKAIARQLPGVALWFADVDGMVVGRAALASSSTGFRTDLEHLQAPTRDRVEGFVLPGSAAPKWLIRFAGDAPGLVVPLRERARDGQK